MKPDFNILVPLTRASVIQPLYVYCTFVALLKVPLNENVQQIL